MGKLTKTKQAENDLIDIWVHIARDNEQAAEKQLDRFEERFHTLAEFPSMGSAVQGLEDEWLSTPSSRAALRVEAVEKLQIIGVF